MRRNGSLLLHGIPFILLLLFVTGVRGQGEEGLAGEEVSSLLTTDTGDVSAARAIRAPLEPGNGVLLSETLEAELVQVCRSDDSARTGRADTLFLKRRLHPRRYCDSGHSPSLKVEGMRADGDAPAYLTRSSPGKVGTP